MRGTPAILLTMLLVLAAPVRASTIIETGNLTATDEITWWRFIAGDDLDFVLVEDYASDFDPSIALFDASGKGQGHGEGSFPGELFFLGLMFTDNHLNGEPFGWNLPAVSVPIDEAFSIKFTNVEDLTRIPGSAVGLPAPGVPTPATLPLFASGLGVMGWFAWRKTRRAAAEALAVA